MNIFDNQYVTLPNQTPWHYVCSAFQNPIAGHYISIPQVAITPMANSLRLESIGRIDSIKTLKDGWDGYGGYAPSKDVCEYAKSLINLLGRYFPSLDSPEIAPTSNGTVLLTWEAQNADAALEIGDSVFSGYIQRAGSFAPIKGDPAKLGRTELSTIAGCLV
jgi:hypothetical protein